MDNGIWSGKEGKIQGHLQVSDVRNFQMVLPFSKFGKTRVGKDQVLHSKFGLSMRHQVAIPSMDTLIRCEITCVWNTEERFVLEV